MLLFVYTLSVVVVASEATGGKAPTIPLNDGRVIPSLGLDTWIGFVETGVIIAKHTEVEDAVTWALDAGYRLIETTSAYDDQIGKAIRKSSVPREDIFVHCKTEAHEHRDIVRSLRNGLKRRGLDYLDLYVIHFPITFNPDLSGLDDFDNVEVWKQMEEAQKLGLTKSIGISNFNESQIERLLEHGKIKPAVLQVEVNLNLAQNRLIEYSKSKDIAVIAHTPFGSIFSKDTKPPPPRVNDPNLMALANKYKKTVPQIVLRYLVQKGVIPISRTVEKKRIEEYINVFDFELTEEEMETLGKFNTGYRVVHPSWGQDHPYYPFEKKVVTDPELANPFHGPKIWSR